MTRLKVGISACLLGDQVRYDGGHKRSSFCADELARHVEFIRLCPEVGIGMPVPRPTIRLEQHGDVTRAVIPKTGEDVTGALQAFADRAVAQTDKVSGYVLCAKSPSCGMERVKVYDPDTGHAQKTGQGLFAARLQQRYPALPLEEDGRLNDPGLRENFIMRVYVYHGWQQLVAPVSKAALLEFHTSLKLLLLAHSQQVYRKLGRELAQTEVITSEFCRYYIEILMQALATPASRANHTNVLQHIQGYFKQQLTVAQKAELTELVLAYHAGHQPLLVPLTLIKHYLREYPDAYLSGQRYLQPYPLDLKLRYAL
ncbi:hypothetical protein IDSA_04720 [Pseudidiomarina salinarum]|uniref:DUF1722 domain-containing protein n=1 Tax=Pseudidiomarina salinarum TaxID=435908 RepID=A0A094J1P8_9GAMM|nr:DUF523 and DUF1722 domain-containing protein [Pseudidiomarina salinarum]KFZ31984.1 hypothetical protein IDSA_04720 [Pseudidiomarina salinarum]RUO70240.1 DUF1722 domain-containing protein [Pseudidiomarina salinarum]